MFQSHASGVIYSVNKAKFHTYKTNYAVKKTTSAAGGIWLFFIVWLYNANYYIIYILHVNKSPKSFLYTCRFLVDRDLHNFINN